MRSINEPVTVFTLQNRQSFDSFFINDEDVELPVINLILLETILYPAGTTNISTGKIVVKQEPFFEFPQKCPVLKPRDTRTTDALLMKVRADVIEYMKMEMPELYEKYTKGLEVYSTFYEENRFAVKEGM